MKRMKGLGKLLVLLGIILLVVLLLPKGRSASNEPPGSAYNTDNSGASALESWLQDLGYQTRRMEYEQFILTPEDHALLEITPASQASFTRAEIQETLRWLNEDGGTLVVVADTWNAGSTLLKGLNAELDLSGSDSSEDFLDGTPIALHPFAHPPT